MFHEPTCPRIRCKWLSSLRLMDLHSRLAAILRRRSIILTRQWRAGDRSVTFRVVN